MTGVLIRRIRDDPERSTEDRHVEKETEGVLFPQGKESWGHQKLEEERKDPSLHPSEGTQPC